MNECDAGGMKKITVQRREQYRGGAFLARGTVKRIAHHGTRKRGKVDSNLVGSSGAQAGLDQAVVLEPKQNAPIGPSLAALAAAGGHPRTVAQVAGDGQFYGT
jgi:hypothetical protein